MNIHQRQEIINIWAKNLGDNNPDALMPLFINPLKRNSILFVGMNPSFSKSNWTQFVNKAKKEGFQELEHLDMEEFYKWDNRETFDIELSIRIHEFAVENSQYYKSMGELIDNQEWEAIDIFPYRKTDQSKFTELIINKDLSLKPFGKELYDFSWSLISEANPKLIIVANATLSNIMNKNSNPRFVFDEELGTYIVNLGNTEVPIFFSRMLTGAGQIDTYTRQRLKWHIQRVLDR